MKKIKLTMTAAFALAIVAAFGTTLKAPEKLASGNANRFEQTTSDCVPAVCSDDPTRGACTGNTIYLTDGGHSCSSSEATFKYLKF